MPSPCAMADFVSYSESLPPLLDRIGAREVFAGQQRILLKPNLVNQSPFPVTLPVAAMAVLVDYVRSCGKAELLIGEGTGEVHVTSIEVLRHHGYEKLAREKGIKLVDLNEVETVKMNRPDCQVFPEFYLPRIALESFIVSFPVLKAHSLAKVTLAMKNMMGFPSHHHYRQGGAWRKSAFHRRMHRSIFELNLYRKPDLSIIDASVGLAEYHLGGPTCRPPVKKLVAGFDPVAVDARGAELLGFDWREVEHIRLANGVLGRAELADISPLRKTHW
jgi:uncharacterized protein (DUF362 family)